MPNVRVISETDPRRWICKICEKSGVGHSAGYLRHYLDFHHYDLEKERGKL